MEETLISITKDELGALVNEAVTKSVSSVREEYARNAKPSFATSQDEVDKNNPQVIGAYVRNLIVANRTNKDIKSVAEEYARRANTLASKIVLKGLNETNDVDGGVFVIPEVSNMFIELLTPQNRLRSINTTKLRTTSGSLEINREDVGAGAFWTTENPGAVTKSNPQYGKYILTPKKLLSWATISNDLLSDAGFNVEQILQNQIIKAAAKVEEVAFLYGGGANEPKGIYEWTAAANKFGITGTTAELIETDLFKMETQVNSVRIAEDLVWLMPFRTFSALRTKARAGSGFLAFPELRETAPSLLGHPVVITNNIPTNGGVGQNESNIFLLNAPDFHIVDRLDQTFKINPVQNDANFPVGIDETLVVSISRVDTLLKYDTGASVLTGVTY